MEPLSKRVEVTLKSLSASSLSQSAKNNLDSLQVGDIISGRVKRLESYGIFITIDNTNVVKDENHQAKFIFKSVESIHESLLLNLL